ncbi:YIP1 family protein [Archaeoglobus profundus]|uniref:Yip1 domain-containing protein n=1 Tax=Archaeoglobus profundus (strain DSM 5631 / JCM 9629 / NBRC 100127 / Av18) TaxID=572546 RepID=D2REG3_ARCPA|nr:YIP1 family protein [Archaeoglobus profundus]ADB58507.1 hypothetical protein Arcpr_1460 [Archaeoglobus profundus DSM 5631]
MLRVLYDPDSFFRDFKGGFKVPVIIVLLSGIVGAIVSYLRFSETAREIVENFSHTLTQEQIEAIIEIARIQSIISPLIGAFVGWILLSLIIHAISALFGGKGNLSRTLQYTSFSFLPQIVLSPLNYYYWSITPTLPTLILSLATTLWQAYILVFALKHARRIETSKAIVCVAIPLAIAYAMSLIGFMLMR